MSRYKKASCNECELEEMDGVKPILRPTRDERMNIIKMFSKQIKGEALDLEESRKLITDLLYNSLFLWEGNTRTDKMEEGSEGIVKSDIDDFVVAHLFELWSGILVALDIIDKNKLEEMKKKAEEEAKAKEKEEKEDPN